MYLVSVVVTVTVEGLGTYAGEQDVVFVVVELVVVVELFIPRQLAASVGKQSDVVV